MSDAMQAEFDTVAAWTADAAVELGPEHFLPAGCRGSGSPGALRWFVDRLGITRTDRMLDCGAGVGGPAAFANDETGVRPFLSEPEVGACRAARRLFGLPVVQAASDLPFTAGSFDVVWSLGVLCTVPDQPRLLAELRRVLDAQGRLGLLVYVAQQELSESPDGNNFPTEAGLRTMLDHAGLRIVDSATTADFTEPPPLWQERADAVDALLQRRHGSDPAWQTAERQSATIGRLLAGGELVGTMIIALPAH